MELEVTICDPIRNGDCNNAALLLGLRSTRGAPMPREWIGAFQAPHHQE